MSGPRSNANNLTPEGAGPRRPSTLPGLGDPAVDQEQRVRDLAEQAREASLASTDVSPIRESLAEKAAAPRAAATPDEPSRRERRTEPARKKKPSPLTLGPAKRAAAKLDTVRRPTAGTVERVEAPSSSRSRRRKKRAGTASKRPTARPAASSGRGARARSEPPDRVLVSEATPKSGLPEAGPRRERNDEKTRPHVYADTELASSALPTGRSDRPAPVTAQPTVDMPSVTGAATATASSTSTSTPAPTPARLTAEAGAGIDSAAPIESSAPIESRTAAEPGASKWSPGRWLPVFVASAMGAFIAVALYWVAFDRGAAPRMTASASPEPSPAEPSVPGPAGSAEAAPIERGPRDPVPGEASPTPEPADEATPESGPLDLGEIPPAIVELSNLERAQLAQDLRIRARFLARGHQYRRAEQVWRLALQHAPDSAAAAHGLAETLLAVDRAEPAMQWARRATELESEAANHEELLGDTLVELGELEGAVVAYRRALELDPDAPGARIRLARVRRRLNAPR